MNRSSVSVGVRAAVLFAFGLWTSCGGDGAVQTTRSEKVVSGTVVSVVLGEGTGIGGHVQECSPKSHIELKVEAPEQLDHVRLKIYMNCEYQRKYPVVASDNPRHNLGSAISLTINTWSGVDDAFPDSVDVGGVVFLAN